MKKITTRNIWWVDEDGRLWPLARRLTTIFVDPANPFRGVLKDGREVFWKRGRWIYIPTGEYLPDGTMIKRP